MKHSYYLLTAAAALMVSALSCSLQETDLTENAVPAEKTVLRLTLAETRTSLGASVDGARKVYWSDGDQIAVNGVESEALADIGAKTASAEFTFESALQTPFNILYPASIYASEGSVTLPAVQTWKEGTFDDGMFPMAGYSADGSSPSLDYLCAVVKVSILLAATDPDTDNIRLVTFSGKAGEQVSGNFGIHYQQATLSATSSDDADKQVSVSLNRSLNTTTPLDVFLVVPARTYASGFSITIQDAQGHTMTKGISKETELTPGKLYNTPSFPFVPSGMATGIEISSAEELIAFATGYNDKSISKNTQPGGVLVATVTQNISFDATTSAAFNATGGIGLKNGINGSEDYYFDGIFNGNGKTISGLQSTVPLFVATNAGAQIKDLTLDNSCSFEFTHPSSVEGDFGAVVGYHRGDVENVAVHSDVSLAPVANVAGHAALGGIVGRIVVGSVKDCVYAGNISVPEGFTVAANKKLMIGGIAAYVSNTDGSVSGTTFNGTICNEGQVLNQEDQSNPYLIIGGIVGYGQGSISDCETETADEPIATSYEALSGTIVNKTKVAYHCAVGGIIGENLATGSVSSCTNAATIATTLFKKDNNNTNGRRLRVGGIAGLNRGSITECDNLAALTNRSNPYFQYLGGIAGYNLGNISSCTNAANLAISTTGVATFYSARYPFLGGIVGSNDGGSVSDVQNSGNVQVSRLENSANCYTYIGGIFGYNAVAIDGGADKKISNSGQVYQDYTYSTLNADGYNLGGIAGKSTAAISNVRNSGTVKYLKDEGDTEASTGAFNLGGIVGKADAVVSDAVNSGEVAFTNSTSGVGSTGGYNLGGIIGLSLSSAQDCSNNGYIHHQHSGAVATTGIHLGGIIGLMSGDGTVSGCKNLGGSDNAGTVAVSLNNYAHTENLAGGIIGMVTGNVAISDCNNSGYIHGGNSSKQNGKTFYVGGIVAKLFGASSISDCENTGELRNNQFNNTITLAGSVFEGGIAGFVQGTADNRVSISRVDNTVASAINGGAGPRRGYGGGTVGYAEFTDISNATNTGNYTGSSSYFIGGIAGWIVNSTITDCSMTGTSISTSQLQKGGGIAAVLGAGSLVTNCSTTVTEISHSATDGVFTSAGAVAGSSESGSTIKNCHYPASGTITNNINNGTSPAWQICGDTNFTDGGGNAADL